jgi:hypothetical protein
MALIWAAVAAVVVYVVGDVVSGLLYDGYSCRDQAISELSAFGSPVRPLMVTVIVIHNVLLLAFGIGVVRVARRRSVRWIGVLQIVDSILGYGRWRSLSGSSRRIWVASCAWAAWRGALRTLSRLRRAGYDSVVADCRVTKRLASRTRPRVGFTTTFLRLRVVAY